MGVTRHSYSHKLSPRVRGNQVERTTSGRRDMAIPVRAGEPGRGWLPSPTLKVYPRVCGRNRDSVQTGVSPARSIPACAGEPEVGLFFWRSRGLYPRVCGGTQTKQPADVSY